MEKEARTNSKKKQRSTIEFIVIVILLSLMIKVLVSAYLNQEESFTEVAFIGISKTFTSKISVVHSQWMMDSQPDVVVLNQLNNEKSYIKVNRKGWIDNNDEHLACQKIWQQVLNSPIEKVKFTVTVIEINEKRNTQNGRICRYSISTGQYFDYNSELGRVTLVN